MAGHGFAVRPLESVGIERWFDIGFAPRSLDEAAATMRDLLSAHGYRTHFRLVAVDAQDRIRAKIGGYTTANGRLTFYDVYHSEGENAELRRERTELLVRSCVIRALATSSIRYIETQPAHDTPEREIFEEAIRAQGLLPVAESRLYERDLNTVETLDVACANYRLVRCVDLSPDT